MKEFAAYTWALPKEDPDAEYAFWLEKQLAKLQRKNLSSGAFCDAVERFLRNLAPVTRKPRRAKPRYVRPAPVRRTLDVNWKLEIP